MKYKEKWLEAIWRARLYFKPVTDFNQFITSDTQRSKEPVIRVQYSKLKRDNNFESIINELREQSIDYGSKRAWRNLLTLLKEDEGDNKFFTSVTPIENFKISLLNCLFVTSKQGLVSLI